MRQIFRRPGPEARLAEAARKNAGDDRPSRLLIIEDDPLFLQLAVDITEALPGFDVRSGGDLADLTTQADWNPDVVLLDLHLPDSDGLDTLRRAMRIVESSSIVVFTGSDEQDLGLQAVRHGAQDFIPKGDLDEDGLERSLRFAVERRRLETVKRRMVKEREENKRLRAVEQERSRFYHSVTSGLRGPMEALSVQMSLLAHDMQDDRRHQHALESLREQVNRLAQVNADLDDVAAVQAGELDVEREVVDLSDLLARRIDQWDEEARAHRLIIQSLLAPGLEVLGDETRLCDLVDRILDNAIHHTPAAGIITVELDQQDGAALRIGDGGSGIIPERLERIFEAYLWEPEARSGMGMGLAICKGIVDAHDGDIRVESDDGTLVTVRLPLAKSSASS